MRKNRLVIFLLIMIFCFSNSAFGIAASVNISTSQNTEQKEALNHLQMLGAIDKLSDSKLDSTKALRRDEFAKMLVIATGLQDTADSLKYQSIFPDVKTNNKMIGYVNASVNKGLMTGMADRKFHPEEDTTFAQLCTAVVKALGYGDNDVTGVWPKNYIEKARTLKLLDGITLKNSDSVQRGIAAVVVDRMLNTNIKKTNTQDTDKTLANSSGIYSDCVILGNSQTLSSLDSNQVLTDKGVFNMANTGTSLTIGGKYRLQLDDSNIVKVFYSLKTLKTITVKNITDTTVTYSENGTDKTMVMPENVSYYYNGTKQNYDNLKNVIQGDSTIAFAYTDDKSSFEYAVIIDPVYSKPEVANNVKADDRAIGSIVIADGEPIIKNGEYIKLSEINNGDIVYQVSDLRNTDKYLYVSDDKVQGKLSAILPNRLFAKTIQIDDKTYTISKDMDLTKLSKEGSAFNIDDTVAISLGYDGKVVDISKDAVVGSYTDCIVLGNSKTLTRLDDNQVITDKGIFYLSDPNIKLELGCKYRLFISDDNILKSDALLNQTTSFVVDSISDTQITYKESNNKKTLNLPDKVVYYYNGTKQTYDNLKNLIQVDSTIIFGLNSNKIGYEYADIIDPVYSKPQIAMNVKVGDTRIGSIDITDSTPVVKDGEFINPYTIQNGDVVYQVSDLNNSSRYILVIDNMVKGLITNILPNRMNPKTIQLDSKNYDLSSDMDLSKLNNKLSPFKVGDAVQISIGNDGKVVNVDYTDGQDNDNYAFVINTSSTLTNGNPVYSVKLMGSDGTTNTYVTGSDYSDLKGTLVTFALVDTNTVKLSSINYSSYSSMNINLEDRRIGDSYAADNIRVFDLISNYSGSDANVKVLNWSELYSGTIPDGKILYENHSGAFNDVNVLLLNDIFDESNSYGLVKTASASGGGGRRTTTYSYTICINGKDYQFTTTNFGNVGYMSVVSAGLYNGQILSFSGSVNPDCETTKIQAIDLKKIMLNNTTYLFRNDVTVYYRDIMGNISQKSVSDIDITKTYSKVGVYLDKPVNEGGKVKMLVVQE